MLICDKYETTVSDVRKPQCAISFDASDFRVEGCLSSGYE
jgi:hypothetical protein